jgi:peptide subunit release factor RF-3
LDPAFNVQKLDLAYGVQLALDDCGLPTLLFTNEWSLKYFQERNPEAKISVQPFAVPTSALKS